MSRQPPIFIAVVVIVFGAFLIRFVHHLLRFTLRNGMHSAKAFDALFIGAGNENIDTAWIIPKNIISTTSHEHAGLLLRQSAYHVTLHFEQSIITQAIRSRDSPVTDKRERMPKSPPIMPCEAFSSAFSKNSQHSPLSSEASLISSLS